MVITIVRNIRLIGRPIFTESKAFLSNILLKVMPKVVLKAECP
jgi:hypothetical protein